MITKKNIHIIAEIGVNHNGDIRLAKRLMLLSKRVGADSVKFQTYDANEIMVAMAGAPATSSTSSVDGCCCPPPHIFLGPSCVIARPWCPACAAMHRTMLGPRRPPRKFSRGVV